MTFIAKFSLIALVILALPFIYILLSIESAANDCLDNIESELPNTITDDMAGMNDVKDNYCDPNTGKFLKSKRMADLIKEIYPGYMIFGIILSLIISVVWEGFE